MLIAIAYQNLKVHFLNFACQFGQNKSLTILALLLELTKQPQQVSQYSYDTAHLVNEVTVMAIKKL